MNMANLATSLFTSITSFLLEVGLFSVIFILIRGTEFSVLSMTVRSLPVTGRRLGFSRTSILVDNFILYS
jgi:hypothetical protein